MPERVVSTLLKIDGEQQYESAIQNINRENGALKASIKLVDEQFRGQANTMAALVEKGKLYTNQQALLSQKVTAAQGMYDKAKSAAQTYADEINKLKNYVASDAKEEEKLAKQLATAQEQYQKAQNATTFYSKAVTTAKTEVEQINNKIKDNARYMDEAKKSANGTATSIDAFGKEVSSAKKETEQLGQTGKEAFDTLSQALAAAGIARSVKEIVDLFVQAVDASNKMETAFTGITKTVEGTDEELLAIKEEMKSLSTVIPLTAVELSKIAEIAGQLGIATGDVSSFTKTVAALTVSTNLSADQAATQLARFAKITGMSASEYDNLGAVIVALGNDSAATESEIVDMAMNIAAAGKQVGMTQPQIMAYAAALTSAGMDSQAGGSAISKTLVEMSLASQKGGDELQKFADIAGMSSEAFASLFKTSSSDALNSFITGLASGSESAIKALDDMGITEIRQRDAILRLANASGTLTDSINTASTAYVENTALTEEAAKFYDTTESKIQLLKNSTNLLAITIGDQFNPAVRDGVDTLTDWTESIDEFLKENPWAIQAVVALTATMGAAAVSIVLVGVSINTLGPAIVKLWAAVAANPIALTIVAITALTAGIVAMAAASEDGTEKYREQIRANRELRDEMEASEKAYKDSVENIESESDAVDGLVGQLEALTKGQQGSKQNTEQIKNVVDQLNSAVSGLNLTYDETTGKLNMTTSALREMTDAMFKQRLQAAMVDRQVEAYIELQDAENNLAATTELLTDKTTEYGIESSKTTDEFGNALSGISPKAAELFGEMSKLTEEQTIQQGVVDESTKKYNALSGSISGASDATSDAAGSMSDASSDVNSLTTAVNQLETAWNDARDAALEAAKKTSEGLNPLDDTPDKNAGKYDQILTDQADFWDNYALNIEKAKQNGLDEGLLATLLDGTEEDAQQLAAYAEMSTEDVQKVNDAYEARAESMENFAIAVANAKTAQSDLYKSITDDFATFVGGLDQSGGAKTAADATMAALKKGLEDGYANLLPIIDKIKQALALADAAEDEADEEAKSHKGGLPYVPYDDYYARLHEGEAVLTKQQAVSWRVLKATSQAARPSARSMVDIQRPMSANDVGRAVGTAVGSIQGGNTYNYSTTIIAPEMPDAYEIDRIQRKQNREQK